MNNEKETKRTIRKTIFIIAMDSIVVILYEVKHYDEY